MLSLVKKNHCIYSTDSVVNLQNYILYHMDEDEKKEAEKMWRRENKTEYGAMFHLCLLEHCSELEGYSILIHRGEYNGNS